MKDILTHIRIIVTTYVEACNKPMDVAVKMLLHKKDKGALSLFQSYLFRQLTMQTFFIKISPAKVLPPEYNI